MIKNEEQLVISRLLCGNTNEQKQFDSYGFSSDAFLTYTRHFKFLTEFKDKYGKYPNKAAFKKKFSDFVFVKTKESMAYYGDQLRERQLKIKLQDVMHRVQPILDSGNASETIARIKEELNSMETYAQATAVDFGNVSKDHYDKAVVHKAKLLTEGKTFDTPYMHLNNLIVMMKAENLVTLSGRPAMGKTFVLLYFALHYFYQGKRVLLVSKEMSQEEFEERLDAIDAKLHWDNFRRGYLSDIQKIRFKKTLARRRKCQGKMFVVGSTQLAGDTIESLSAEMDTYTPDVVLVDGIQQYEVRGVNDEIQKYAKLSRITKRLAKVRKVLLIQTVHQKRQNEGKKKINSGGLSGLAWADQIGRDSDLAFEIYSDADEDPRMSDYRIIKIIKGRDTGYGEFRINFKFAPRIDLSETTKVASRYAKDPKRLKAIMGKI